MMLAAGVARPGQARMSFFLIRAQLRVAPPDQAMFAILLLLPRELVAKARHHPGQKRAPIAIAADTARVLVLQPQSLAGLGEKVVHVVGHLHVGAAAADLD